MNNNMRDSMTGDISSRVQLYGVLSKKASGGQSSKWGKRFCIIKDGFLLYYAENDRKEFERKGLVGVHPKAAIPLGECQVTAHREIGHSFCISIQCIDVLPSEFLFGVESEYEQVKWIECIQKASRIHWKNSQLGDALIEHYESTGLKIREEKQEMADRLKSESEALYTERQKTEELERIRNELEKEKETMERLADELKDDFSRLKGEMSQTHDAMRSVENEKISLQNATVKMQKQLEDLAKEKKRITDELKAGQSEALKLSQEKKSLKETTEQMKSELQSIEHKTQYILSESSMVKQMIEDNNHRAQQLEDERNLIQLHAKELQESIKELTTQKAATEAELKEEVIARLEAEKRLNSAEQSLKRLEKAVENNDQEHLDQEQVREEMIGDVKTLKKFFENLAFDKKIEAETPLMVKTALESRRTCVRRAKTLRQASKRVSWRGRVEDLFLPRSGSADRLNRRCHGEQE